MATIGGVRPALAATAMDVPNPSGPKSNSWLPKLQLRPGLARRRAERYLCCSHHHRAQSFPRRLPRRDQRARRA